LLITAAHRKAGRFREDPVRVDIRCETANQWPNTKSDGLQMPRPAFKADALVMGEIERGGRDETGIFIVS